MNKNFWLFKTTAYVVLVLMLFSLSCRKMDISHETTLTVNTLEEKFFNSHRTADPTEKSFVEFLKRKNDKLHFVEKTVKQIGFPRWDKAISKRKAAGKLNGRTGSDSSEIVYVPFVRDSQNYVNAAMLIKTTASDTSFSYLCDWQYKAKINKSITADTSADKYALFFMFLDNRTLGHEEFMLTDTALFLKSKPKGAQERKLKFLNISTPANQKTNLFAYHEVCLDFYVCGNPDWCADHGGCDYLHCAASPGDEGYCYLVQSFCDGWWEDTGGGGSDSGTSTGDPTGTSGGGGGSTGSDGTPPTCGGILVARTSVAQGCDPGWYPTGGGTSGTYDYRSASDYNTGDDDNNTTGGYDNTNYNDYDPTTFTWPSIPNVIPISSFVGWGTPGISRNCMSYAKAQIAKLSYQISNYGDPGQTIQIYTSANGSNISAAKNGVGYLLSALGRGIPVIVGVDDQPGSPNPNTDNTTDHFIVIVGSGTDTNGNYFTFYDNASGDPIQGASPRNKLYYDSSTGLLQGHSQTSYANSAGMHDYIVTMIRKSK